MALDSDFAAHLREDLDPEDFVHVLTLLRQDVTGLATRMEAAIEAGDLKAFRSAAHGLAGAACSVGADALEQAARSAMEGQVISRQVLDHARDVLRLADATLAGLGAGQAGP